MLDQKSRKEANTDTVGREAMISQEKQQRRHAYFTAAGELVRHATKSARRNLRNCNEFINLLVSHSDWLSHLLLQSLRVGTANINIS